MPFRRAARRLGRLSLAGLLLAGGPAAHAQPPSAVPLPPPAPAAPPAPPRPSAPAPVGPRPGTPAPGPVLQELRTTLGRAVERFEARDLEGVLAHVSERYWTGPFTKPALRAQLLAIFQLHQRVQARVRIDEVRLVGEHAWVWTSGEVSGQVAWIGQWVGLFGWERELEVARREDGGWRLYGYQQ
jgi:hypothetical protein